jgi:hypothetical protein
MAPPNVSAPNGELLDAVAKCCIRVTVVMIDRGMWITVFWN